MSIQRTLSTTGKTLVALAAMTALAGVARADVLDDVKANGVVKCGVTLAAPGFSAEDNAGKRGGFDVDLCKSIAAAALGDDSKIQLVPMDLKTAFAGLPTGAVDVLTHRFTWTQSRDVGGLKFAKVMFFDGQGFAVTKKSKANKIADLNNATICTAQGSTSELIVADYFRAHKLKYKIVTFASQEQAWDGRRRGTGRHAGQRRRAAQFAEPGRAAAAGHHRRLRRQAGRGQRLGLQGHQGRGQLRRNLGPKRGTQDAAAAGPRA